ncbi:hypothetical protein RJ640_020918 [Escallonia rubra]|uniref:B box-type domain-containing protein n=1 Tax=Escallonia rubra TaxID=112253 RepID=A0AA88S2Q9_9ASTE|nr:hypothetical protein RJ640_020918 [Escallonia rubra]
MKIQCDVCNKDEASVFCSADEAALCTACDHRVHHANKLAGKHQRFSLLHPSPKETPLCDICQEKRAFLFCQQDRAILCSDCDIPIHKANEHTKNHNRFLLTGVKLSASSSTYPSPSPSRTSSATSLTNTSVDVPNVKAQNSVHKPISVPTSMSNPPPVTKSTTTSTSNTRNSQLLNGVVGSGTMSSISEYLIETLPGWHVEDFLDSNSDHPSGLSKTGKNDVFPFWDSDLDGSLSSFSSENTGIWVPQAPPALQHPSQSYLLSNMSSAGQIGFKDSSTNIKSSRKRRDDNCFAVPQISPSSTAFKRSRTLW